MKPAGMRAPARRRRMRPRDSRIRAQARSASVSGAACSESVVAATRRFWNGCASSTRCTGCGSSSVRVGMSASPRRTTAASSASTMPPNSSVWQESAKNTGCGLPARRGANWCQVPPAKRTVNRLSGGMSTTCSESRNARGSLLSASSFMVENRRCAPPLPLTAVNTRCPAWRWKGWPPASTANEYTALRSPRSGSMPNSLAEGSSSASTNEACPR